MSMLMIVLVWFRFLRQLSAGKINGHRRLVTRSRLSVILEWLFLDATIPAPMQTYQNNEFPLIWVFIVKRTIGDAYTDWR